MHITAPPRPTTPAETSAAEPVAAVPATAAGPELETILVVDDTPANLSLISEMLLPDYRVRAANSGSRALSILGSGARVDLVLLDIMMPNLDGYEVLRRIRENPALRALPVIFVTAIDGETDEERGLALGAVDYVTKPVRPAILRARVRAHLELKRARDALADRNRQLETEVGWRMQENELVKDVTLMALAKLAEARDNETGNHLVRTQSYVAMLADHLRDHSRFAEALAGRQRDLVVQAAPLHDIGKVGIPDAILLKPGRLTPEEFEVIQRHPRIGGEALSEAMNQVLARRSAQEATGHAEDSRSALAFLEVARQIAQSHHEKWDGSGYPEGLQGDRIPVAARLMAVADVFDALSCHRHYKPRFPPEQVEAMIREGRGKHFDPAVVDAFLALKDRFHEVATRLADEVPDAAG